MKKLAIYISTILASNLAFAGTAQASSSDDYVMFCGNRQQVLALMQSRGVDTSQNTEANLKDLNNSRKPLLRILAKGESEIRSLLNQQSRSNEGVFRAMMNCKVILDIKSEIRQNGCLDLGTGKRIRDNGGIAACEDFVKE